MMAMQLHILYYGTDIGLLMYRSIALMGRNVFYTYTRG